MEAGLAHARVKGGDVDCGNAGQVGAAAGELATAGVQKARAERAHAAHAAVVGGAAANGQRHVARSGVQRGADELAGTVGTREQRVLLARRKEREAGGSGHLYDGAPAGQHGVGGVHRTAQGVAHANPPQLTTTGLCERGGRAVTTVRHVDAEARAARKVPTRGFLEQARGSRGRERPLERVRRKDKLGRAIHGATSPSMPPL